MGYANRSPRCLLNESIQKRDVVYNACSIVANATSSTALKELNGRYISLGLALDPLACVPCGIHEKDGRTLKTSNH
jgi:hypothetical protein